MKILVDRQSIEIDESQVHNLEEILLTIVAGHVKPGNEVTTVRLNGELYSEKQPHDAAKVELSDIHTLEIGTMGKEEVARRFSESGVGQLDMIIQAAEKISELFRIGDIGEANEHYAEFLESLRLFMKMLAEIKEILQLDLSTIPFQDRTAEGALQQLSEMMDRMIRIQEGEDWIMLADLLEYGVASLLKGWQEVLPVLAQGLPDEASS